MKIKNTSPSVDDEVGAGVDSEEEVAHVDQVVDDGVGRALVTLALDGSREVAAHLKGEQQEIIQCIMWSRKWH